MSNAGLRNKEEIKKGIERAKFVQKGELLSHVYYHIVVGIQPFNMLTKYHDQKSRLCEFDSLLQSTSIRLLVATHLDRVQLFPIKETPIPSNNQANIGAGMV